MIRTDRSSVLLKPVVMSPLVLWLQEIIKHRGMPIYLWHGLEEDFSIYYKHGREAAAIAHQYKKKA